MSKVTFEYPHLERAQEIMDTIHRYFDKFDWSWTDGDRDRNFKAVQKVLSYDEDLFWLSIRLRTVETEDGDTVRSVYAFDPRLNTYIDLNPSEGIDNKFDFVSPLDVLSLLDELEEMAEEYKSFYQIKIS